MMLGELQKENRVSNYYVMKYCPINYMCVSYFFQSKVMVLEDMVYQI